MSEWFDKLSYYYYSIVYKFRRNCDYLRSLFEVTNVFGLPVRRHRQTQGYTVIDTDYSNSKYLSYEDIWNLDDTDDPISRFDEI